jgi:polyisoprenoid-binding protein YceI
MIKNLTIALSVAFICQVPSLAQGAGQDNAWTIDPAHSTASFAVKHMMISNVNGNFTKLSGNVNYDGKSIADASVNAVINADSVNTNEPQRDGHLKSKDFFDVADYPTITFKSNKIVPGTDGSFKILGTLTMHGVSKEVTLDADALAPIIKDPHGKLRTGTSASTKVNRKDYGISFDKNMDNGGAIVGDDVKITLDVELVKAADSAKVSSK